MTLDVNKQTPWMFIRKGEWKIVIITVSIMLGLWLTIGIFAGSILFEDRKASIKNYCSVAGLYPFYSCVDRVDTADVHGRRTNSVSYKSLESNKYKNEQSMLDKLPENFSEAVKAALSEGKTDEAVDLDNTPLTRYRVPEDKLPLDKTELKTDIYRRYYVYKYPDGTYRFAILVEITDPDY